MNTSKLIGTVAFACIASGTALVSYQSQQHHNYAAVVHAKLVTENVSAPRERCYEESVTRAAMPVLTHAVTRHGKFKHAVRDSSENDAVFAADAMAGQPVSIEQRCETVYDAEQQPAGYEVEYRYAGKPGVVHMDHDPGTRIPVENGELVLNNDAANDETTES